jgi:hypothetical protein
VRRPAFQWLKRSKEMKIAESASCGAPEVSRTLGAIKVAVQTAVSVMWIDGYVSSATNGNHCCPTGKPSKMRVPMSSLQAYGYGKLHWKMKHACNSAFAGTNVRAGLAASEAATFFRRLLGSLRRPRLCQTPVTGPSTPPPPSGASSRWLEMGRAQPLFQRQNNAGSGTQRAYKDLSRNTAACWLRGGSRCQVVGGLSVLQHGRAMALG